MDDTGLHKADGGSEIADGDVSAEVRLSREQLLLKSVADRALAAWTHFGVDIGSFATLVFERIQATEDRDNALDSLAIEELFLCYACSAGSQAAIETFSREFESELKAAANKLRVTGGNYDDVRQSLWSKLFLGDEKRGPRVLDYRGTGPLRHWFRVLATRTVLDYTRQERRNEVSRESHQRTLSDAAPNVDPELDNIRRRYSGDFRMAFERAIGEMSPEERNLLRCAYLNGMSTDEIGRAFGMHKATAARHVSKARERLLELTRTHLKRELGANSGELDSVIRLFDGELSVSLSRLLR